QPLAGLHPPGGDVVLDPQVERVDRCLDRLGCGVAAPLSAREYEELLRVAVLGHAGGLQCAARTLARSVGRGKCGEWRDGRCRPRGGPARAGGLAWMRRTSWP